MGKDYHWKFLKHNFEILIVVDSKGPPSGPTFWSGLEAPNHKGRVVAASIFRQKCSQKKLNWKIGTFIWISHHQSIDNINSLLSSHKSLSVIAKNVCPNMGMRAIFWP